MRALDSAGQAPARVQFDAGDVDAALASAARTVSATYAFRYQGHMPIGPSCAVADVTPSGAVVLANTQDAYRLRTVLADAARPAVEPGAGRVLGGRRVVRQRAGALRHRRRGGGHVAARGRAGAAAVHALGRARLGQLQPRGARRPARRRGRAREARRVRLHRVRHPRDVDDRRPDEPARRHPAAAAGPRQRVGRELRHAVRHPEPARDRQVAAACSTRSSRRPRCARPARRRRRSRPSSWSTSSPTRPGSTRTSSACRTSRPRR